MTLNCHFALKSVSGSATNGLAFLAFAQNCSKICRAAHTLSATKIYPGILVSSKVRLMRIFAGVRWIQEGQMRVGSSKMAIFASFVRCIFRTCTFKATFIIFYYVAPSWLLGVTEINDFELP